MSNIKTSGPYILTCIDPTDDRYLRLTFSDGHSRELAKGGNWPPIFAIELLAKANTLVGKSVFIKTSQTTKPWDTTDWLCDIFEAKP
jgi:hypothetical protein